MTPTSRIASDTSVRIVPRRPGNAQTKASKSSGQKLKLDTSQE